MVLFRRTDPVSLQCIWDVICLAEKNGNSDREGIVKLLMSEKGYSNAESQALINKTIKDRLIEGAKFYSMPKAKNKPSANCDWYCFQCHLGGEVEKCSNCHRIFHTDCVKDQKELFDVYTTVYNNSDTNIILINYTKLSIKTNFKLSDILSFKHFSGTTSPLTYNNKICIACNIKVIESNNLTVKELNDTLRFIFKKISGWIPRDITCRLDKTKVYTSEQVNVRKSYLFFQNKSIKDLDVNIRKEKYTSFADFFGDILTIRHNAAIFHGINTQEFGAAEFLLRDALYELKEARQCIDCYLLSKKNNKDWFTFPCREPHKIVWAKNRGYSYWPAKVIKENGIHFEVRFFGGKHYRSVIEEKNIKPIEISSETLQLKITNKLQKAIDQMQIYQNNLTVKKNQQNEPDSFTGNTLGNVPVATGVKKKNQKRQNSVEESPSKRHKPEKLNRSSISSECSFTVVSFLGENDNEAVSSSTESKNSSRVEHEMQKLYSSQVTRMQMELERRTDRKEIIQHAMDCMQNCIEKHIIEMSQLKKEMSEAKKKQWCRFCEQPAIYHCCWNTAYCSTNCQQSHWQSEHKKFCRRKK